MASNQPSEKLVLDKRALTKWAVAGAIAVVVIIATVIYNSPENVATREAERHAKNADIYAQVACENAIEARLKAPSTADFGNYTVTGFAGDYKVSGSVDSENGFGAMIRSDFTCEVKVDGERTNVVDLAIH